MAETLSGRPIFYWLLYAGLAMAIFFIDLLPLETTPRRWAAPDLLLALTIAWALRKPDYTPALLVGAVFLLADFLLQRPPGLYALVVVLGLEFLRSRGPDLRNAPFVFEWFVVALVLTGMTLVHRLASAVAFLEPPALGLTVVQMLLTLLAYPLVVLASHYLFGVRARVPGKLDDRGIGA